MQISFAFLCPVTRKFSTNFAKFLNKKWSTSSWVALYKLSPESRQTRVFLPERFTTAFVACSFGATFKECRGLSPCLHSQIYIFLEIGYSNH